MNYGLFWQGRDGRLHEAGSEAVTKALSPRVTASVTPSDAPSSGFVGIDCPKCGGTQGVIQAGPATLGPDAPSFAECSNCGFMGELTNGGQLKPIAAKSSDGGVAVALAKSQAAIAASRAAREASWQVDGYSQMESNMDPNFELRKRLVEGQPISEALMDEEWREEAELIHRRPPYPTAEKAFDLAGQSPVDRFKPIGPTNPTRYQLHKIRTDARTETPIMKQASAGEAEAWAGLEAIATGLRAKDPKLTKEAAISKALVTAHGQKFYSAYSRAQQIAARGKEGAA